jgi:HTH-type transcriptional regulator / antitoxin HigA
MQKDIKAGSKESDELEILVILIKEYENEHFPIPKPNPLKPLDSG